MELCGLGLSRYCISVRLIWVEVAFALWQEACHLIASCVDGFYANGVSVVL